VCGYLHAGVAYNMGLVSEAVQAEISQRTEEIVQLVSQGSWEQVSSLAALDVFQNNDKGRLVHSAYI